MDLSRTDGDFESSDRLFGRTGSWSIGSESDERWKASGVGEVGGLHIPEAAAAAITQLEVEFGPPPEDLTWSYMKDRYRWLLGCCSQGVL